MSALATRTIAWLAIGLAWAVTFFVIVWPMLLVYAAAGGVVLAALSWRRNWIPRARALDPAERTWRRYR